MDEKIKNMDEKMKKRGQMTIWIIIAVFLAASVILFLFIERKASEPIEVAVEEGNPKQFIKKCVENYADEAVAILLPQGGFIEPEQSIMYKGINVSYLCYNRGNYHPCINQHPMLLSEMQKVIENYVEPRVDSCFNELKTELEKRNFDVSMGEMEMNVALAPKRIYVDIQREMTISQRGESSSYDNFDVEIISPLYDLARIAMEIANQEAEYCYFEFVGYMILYPEFKIKKDSLSESSSIYVIEDKKSGKIMNIAIRGCAIPPGL